MRVPRAILTPAVLLLVVAGSSCGYAPMPPNGQQVCAAVDAGAKRCPDGYMCAIDGKCWQEGSGPSTGGGGTGGTGGAGGSGSGGSGGVGGSGGSAGAS